MACCSTPMSICSSGCQAMRSIRRLGRRSSSWLRPAWNDSHNMPCDQAANAVARQRWSPGL
jgi:hypothetical protein